MVKPVVTKMHLLADSLLLLCTSTIAKTYIGHNLMQSLRICQIQIANLCDTRHELSPSLLKKRSMSCMNCKAELYSTLICC